MSLPIVLLGASLTLLAAPSLGCSPLPGGASKPIEGMGLKMAKSQIVVYGVGEKAIPDERFPYDNVYSMEFAVRCIYKRDPDTEINHYITINEIGEIPGMCFATNITSGVPVIIYLNQGDDNAFKPAFSSDPGGSVHRDELIGLCDFNPEYPSNLNPAILEEGECDVDYDYPGYCHDPEEEVEPELPPTDPPAPPSPPPPPADTTPAGTGPTGNKLNDAKDTKQPNPPAMDGDKTPKTVEVDEGGDAMDKDTGKGVDPPYQPAKGNDPDKSTAGGDENSSVHCTLSMVLLVLVTMLSVWVL